MQDSVHSKPQTPSRCKQDGCHTFVFKPCEQVAALLPDTYLLNGRKTKQEGRRHCDSELQPVQPHLSSLHACMYLLLLLLLLLL
jgi:hypothetical protein